MTSKPNMANVSRRDLLKLAGVGAAAAILAPGCGTATGSDTAVSWQAIPSYSLQSTDPKRLEYLGQQRVAFEGASSYRLDPQVTSADTAAAMAKLLLQASQGRAPDVAQVDGYIFGRMAAYTQPLTDQMARAGLRLDDWFPSLQPVMTGGGGWCAASSSPPTSGSCTTAATWSRRRRPPGTT